MKNENYINIQGWMINDLKLSGNKLIIYAIIYGFSQDGKSEFTGSLNYLSKSINSTKPTVIKILKELVESGLLWKRVEVVNNINFNAYSVNLEGSKETLPLVKKLNGGGKEILLGGSKETLPNNTIINNTSNNNNNKGFSFSNSLESTGANLNLIADWLKVRKTKKATNSQTAFKLFLNQVEKSDLGINEVLIKCIENDWKSFNASWISKKLDKKVGFTKNR